MFLSFVEGLQRTTTPYLFAINLAFEGRGPREGLLWCFDEKASF